MPQFQELRGDVKPIDARLDARDAKIGAADAKTDAFRSEIRRLDEKFDVTNQKIYFLKNELKSAMARVGQKRLTLQRRVRNSQRLKLLNWNDAVIEFSSRTPTMFITTLIV